MKNKIRELRERMGITQEQLGEMAETSRQAINAIETGKYEPSIWIAYNISRVFRVTIEEIFLFEESIKKLRSDSSKGRSNHGVKAAAV